MEHYKGHTFNILIASKKIISLAQVDIISMG
jgi:hypothetical protein